MSRPSSKAVDTSFWRDRRGLVMSTLAEVRKILGYAATGGVAAIVDVTIFAILFKRFDSHTIPAMVSFILAAIVNYCLSSFLVFHTSLSLRRWLVFLYFAAVGFVINVSFTLVALRIIGSDPILAKLCGVAIAFVFNYIFNRLFVFQRLSPDASCP